MKYLYKPQIDDGRLVMSVIDPAAKSVVWTNTFPAYIEDKHTGDLIEDYTLVELGTMKGVNDVDGLSAYLKEIGVLNEGDILTLSFVEGLHQRLHQYEKGGRPKKFKLAEKIGKKLIGEPVPKKFQKQYGKTYDKKDAMEAGKNIAGSLVNEKKDGDDKQEKEDLPREKSSDPQIQKIIDQGAGEKVELQSGNEDNTLSKVFELKYGIAPKKLYEASLENKEVLESGYEYAFAEAAHKLGVSWDTQDRYVLAEMQVALLEEGIDFKEQIDGRDVDEAGEIILPALEKPLPPKPTSALESFSTVVSTDDLRPAMMGVYSNAKRQEMAATDAHILAVRKEKITGESKVVNIGKPIALSSYHSRDGKETTIPHGGIIDARFPDYPVVVPDDNVLVYKSVPLHSIYKQLNGVIKALKKFRKYSGAEIVVSVDTPILSFFFSAILFRRLLDFFFKNGIAQADFEFSIYNTSWMGQEDESNIGNRGVIIRASTNKSTYGLMMPIYGAVERSFFVNLKGFGTPTIDKKYKDLFAKKTQVLEKIENFLKEGGKKFEDGGIVLNAGDKEQFADGGVAKSVSEKMLDFIVQNTEAGRTVYLTNARKSYAVNKKLIDKFDKLSRPLFKLHENGDLLMSSGNSYVIVSHKNNSLVKVTAS